MYMYFPPLICINLCVHIHVQYIFVGFCCSFHCRCLYCNTKTIILSSLYSSGLGYHEDLKTRTSFIEVLTSILNQGAQFSSLAETALADRLNHMLELVTTETVDGDLPLVMALIDSVPPEHVVSLQQLT